MSSDTKPEWFYKHEMDDNRRFDSIQDSLDEIIRSQKEFHEKVSPMFAWFEHMTWGKKTQLNILKMTGLVTSVILGLMAVFAGLWQGIKLLIVNVK
jgi:hypothetical protein